jgi:hypothetical protein
MNTEEPRDILITIITMEYGSASHTRDMLKVERTWLHKQIWSSRKYSHAI